MKVKELKEYLSNINDNDIVYVNIRGSFVHATRITKGLGIVNPYIGERNIIVIG